MESFLTAIMKTKVKVVKIRTYKKVYSNSYGTPSIKVGFLKIRSMLKKVTQTEKSSQSLRNSLLKSWHLNFQTENYYFVILFCFDRKRDLGPYKRSSTHSL